MLFDGMISGEYNPELMEEISEGFIENFILLPRQEKIRMEKQGKYYITLTGDEYGNDKYSVELKNSIEEAGQLCLDNLNSNSFAPIMMMGNIQSGKTRAFIGLMSLCFDNSFDMTIILTKCSTALVKQTVSRMMAEFDCFREGNATVGEVVAQDILEIDFRGCTTMTEKEAVVKRFLKRYKGKKRIIVVKKQADNVDRLNLFIESIVKYEYYNRLLIVDDEADITSVGYEKFKGQEQLSLRRISGAINTMRKSLHSHIEHVLMQVTATPYALYLQPAYFSNDNIMPIKPTRTVVLPTGKGYIGGNYYFIDSEDEQSENYEKAKYLLHIVAQDEMSILNGSRKNSGKNHVITDKRTVRMDDFLRSKSGKTFALPSLRNWIFDILVGTAIVQLTEGNEDYYLSAVLHAAIAKSLHRNEKEIIEEALEVLINALEDNINDDEFKNYVRMSYEDLIQSVKEYGVLRIPSIDEVLQRIAKLDENGEVEGLINEVDIKEVNSDSDIQTLLNITTGELKLENSLTIFVGGQVLDRGITIPNMISFFYGRDPKTMQQDTVMQHCRMFGYRAEELLSVTRFYTTYRLFSSMKEITIRDNILRERMLRQTTGEVVYLEAGGKIKACSPQKILASEIHSILPEKRYLPVGFDIIKKDAGKAWTKIDKIIRDNNGYLDSEKTSYKKGQDIEGRYVTISADDALEILRIAYSVMEPKEDGRCNEYKEMESVFLFSLSERMESGDENIALIVRKDRALGKMKRKDSMYQDAPDDGNNEGAIAKILRSEMPVLVLTEQKNPEWGKTFWWPVYYTPDLMNVGLYSEEQSKTGVYENIMNASPLAMKIDNYQVINEVGINEDTVSRLQKSVDDIISYHLSDFYIDDAVEQSKKRKPIDCPVYINTQEVFATNDGLVQFIDRTKKKIKNVLKRVNDSDNLLEMIFDYFDSLLEKNANDEEREKVVGTIENLEISKSSKRNLNELINEVDEMAQNVGETFGYFIVLGSGRCEIRLNYDAIEKYCIEKGYSEESVTLFMEYVLSHEMFHAMHYADIMTESGRWLYTRKDYHKQGTVKEALAEYFALCYAKDKIPVIDGEMNIADNLREMRNVDNFPYDGGYSGALIMERDEKGGYHGNENDKFIGIYVDSLRDMPHAFQGI